MKHIIGAAWSAVLCLSASVASAQEVPVDMVEHVVAAPLTFEQACCALKCLPPGEHRICFLHPRTCCPVEVCFCLPCGCYCLDCKEGCFADKLVFDFKGHKNDVVVKFKKNGTVSVN
jgi:hypothetical protein